MAQEPAVYKCYVSEKINESDKHSIRSTVCQNLIAEHEHEGKHFCLLHYPNLNKSDEFTSEYLKRLKAKDYNFQGVYFPIDLNFRHKIFDKRVSFKSATFSQNISFRDVTFSKLADFGGAIFSKGVSFDSTKFLDLVSFCAATFEDETETFFRGTVFRDYVDFSYSRLKGYIIFEGLFKKPVFVAGTSLDFEHARLENPERVSFKNVSLRPGWFINIDSRKFIFLDVDWKNAKGKLFETIAELDNVDLNNRDRAFRLLTITCRQLAINCEENNHYEQASGFRRMSMELVFLEKFFSLILHIGLPLFFPEEFLEFRAKYPRTWTKRFKNFVKTFINIPQVFSPIRQSLDLTYFFYRTVSFYGESWRRALLILFIILFGFSLVYMLTNFQVCPMEKPLTLSIQQNLCETRTLNFREAILHSLATATFQNIEYQKPVTLAGEIIRIFEKIFAPLQAALLALALRRKFMR